MKILYLYAELMGYQIPIFKEYVVSYEAEVHVVHWDKKKLTPYTPSDMDGVTYYNRSEYNYENILNLTEKINPSLVYVSGWMDKDYIKVCKKLKRRGVTIVAGSDTQWKGNIKQTIGSIYFRLFLKKNFHKIWVAGPYQYEYARKLGFKKREIIFNCLSADTEMFSQCFHEKSSNLIYPRKFLFLGRFEEIKGIQLLLEAWANIKDKKGWSLTFIGNGSLKELISNQKDVEVHDFMQPLELSKSLYQYGCLVLPSIKEPWALVIHEAMAAGIPVIASDACGSASVFIIPKFTGYTFVSENTKDLEKKIVEFINLKEKDFFELSSNSFKRSTIITPKIAAASFISALNIY